MEGNRNKRGGRELSSAHPYGGAGMVSGRSYKLNLRTRNIYIYERFVNVYRTAKQPAFVSIQWESLSRNPTGLHCLFQGQIHLFILFKFTSVFLRLAIVYTRSNHRLLYAIVSYKLKALKP
jgi:hypothetical protein